MGALCKRRSYHWADPSAGEQGLLPQATVHASEFPDTVTPIGSIDVEWILEVGELPSQDGSLDPMNPRRRDLRLANVDIIPIEHDQGIKS